MKNVPKVLRELSPFEHYVLSLLSDGFSNASIARKTDQTIKCIENTISRTKTAFEMPDLDEYNLRVTLACAYRVHFGDKAIQDPIDTEQWPHGNTQGTLISIGMLPNFIQQHGELSINSAVLGYAHAPISNIFLTMPIW